MKPKRKLPYMPWFVAVWLTDQAVCGLSPTARGVWFDWLNHMWADEQRGILSGTKELLAKLGRCDVSVVDSVADELVSTRAAIVTRSPGVVTVLNRRMHRLFKSRESNALRKSRSRAKARSPDDVTGQILHPPNPPQNSLLEFAKVHCSLDEATFDELREIASDDSAFQHALEAVAGTQSQGADVRNWPAYFKTLLRQNARATGGPTLAGWLAEKQRALEARIARDAEQAELLAQRSEVRSQRPEEQPSPAPAPTPAEQRRKQVREFMATEQGKALKSQLAKHEITPAQFEQAITNWLATENTEPRAPQKQAHTEPQSHGDKDADE